MVRALDDFHIRFEGGGSDWQVAVENVPAGTSARSPLRWPVLPEPMAAAWVARSSMRRDPGPGSGLASFEEIGDALFRAVFSGQAGECLRSGLDYARQCGGGLRLWIHPGGQPMLEALPWEVLYDHRGERFLAQSEWTPVVRRLESPEPLGRQRPRRPLRVLVPTACPTDRRGLGVDRELAAIARALDAGEEGDVVLESLTGATLEKLRRRLDDGRRPCHVVHFIGHAGFDAAIRAGALVFEEDGGSRPVGARHLGPLFLDHDTLQLLVINACEGSKTPLQGGSPGLAQALMRQRIPAVVAMQAPITDSAAIAFAGHFYSALAAGCAVDVAVARCHKAMFPQGREADWVAPVLYLRSVQPPLLPVRSPVTRETAVPRTNQAPARSAAGGGGGAGSKADAAFWARMASRLRKGRSRWWSGIAAAVLLASVASWLRLGPGWPRQPESVAPAAGEGLVIQRLPEPSAPSQVPLGSYEPGRNHAAGAARRPARGAAAAPSAPKSAGYAATPTTTSASAPEVPECPRALELAMRFMRLGPGTFLMGSPHGGVADERPAHYVTLSAFCMGAYEVTQRQWREVMGEAPDRSAGGGDDLPVADVSWDDVQVFLARLNRLAGSDRYRLPTEAQWEYAARAGSSGAYSFGDDPGELYRFGNCKSLDHEDGFDRAAPVGSFLPNRWGLYDLYGNVSEWVEDAYDRYGASPVQDPHVLDGTMRVRRGGSWAIIPKNCRSAFRNKSRPDMRKNDVGFRLVRVVE